MNPDMKWVVVALGEDVNTFVGDPYEDRLAMVASLFKQLTGATSVTRIRKTMDRTWQAYLMKDKEALGYFVLYEEE